jgi:hypothetical protein
MGSADMTRFPQTKVGLDGKRSGKRDDGGDAARSDDE